MESKDWSLVGFTIMSQLAAGVFLVCLGFKGCLVSRAGLEIAKEVMRNAVFVAALLLIVSLFISLLHLGRPGRAFHAVRNMPSSWLSREVFFTGALTAVLCLLAILHIAGGAVQGVVKLLEWTGAVLALSLIFCMSNVYRLRTVPPWNSVRTPVAFFTTALLLGALAYAIACVSCFQTAHSRWLAEILQMVGILALLLVGIEFVIIPLSLFMVDTGSSLFQGTAILWNQHRLTFALRLVLVYAGVGLMSAGLFTNSSHMVYPAFILVLAGEVVGRFLFYATYTRVGI